MTARSRTALPAPDGFYWRMSGPVDDLCLELWPVGFGPSKPDAKARAMPVASSLVNTPNGVRAASRRVLRKVRALQRWEALAAWFDAKEQAL